MNQLKFCVILLLVLVRSFHGEATGKYEVEAREIYKVILCKSCSGQTILESNSKLASDMREFVMKKLEEGKSKGEIISELKSYYGDDITTLPPFKTSTYVLWFGPIALVLFGSLILLRRVR